jgi:Predicted membrane protein (DUF2142)
MLNLRFGALAAGIILLVVAWIAATVPFGAPDEASHYERAYGLSRGVILGHKAVYGPTPVETRTQEVFLNHDTRAVQIPEAMIPPGTLCLDGKPDSSSCLVASPNGNFQPLGYVLPAVAIRASSDVSTALWVARGAAALQSIAFLLLAAALLWGGAGWSLLGMLAAVTPMVLFTSSILNPSGIEVASSLAFAAGLLRVARSSTPATAPSWIWWSLAISGAVGILTGPIGLVFAIADLAVFAALVGVGGLRELGRGRRPRIVAAVLVIAAVVSLAYSKIAGFDTRFGISPFGSSLHGGWDQLRPVLEGAVGNFGALTVQLPKVVVALWLVLVLGLVFAALRVGTRRERLTMTVVTVLALAFPVLFWAWIDRYSGFGVQGREVLPVLMLIPLLAGELRYRNDRGTLGGRRDRVVLGAFVSVLAGIQAYAWWLSARVAAGAPGTLRFYAHATWNPPLGWAPWITVAALGTVSLLAFGIGDALSPAAPDQRPARMVRRPSSNLTAARH